MEIITGGVTGSKGIFGSRRRGRDQVSEQKRYGNGVFQNAVSRSGRVYDECSKAAPVLWDKEVVESEWEAQAIVVNSGIANACTGKLGYEYCRETAGAAADALEISPQSVLICSTGVIGMQLPMEK